MSTSWDEHVAQVIRTLLTRFWDTRIGELREFYVPAQALREAMQHPEQCGMTPEAYERIACRWYNTWGEEPTDAV
jgi:hypothetical protein